MNEPGQEDDKALKSGEGTATPKDEFGSGAGSGNGGEGRGHNIADTFAGRLDKVEEKVTRMDEKMKFLATKEDVAKMPGRGEFWTAFGLLFAFIFWSTS